LLFRLLFSANIAGLGQVADPDGLRRSGLSAAAVARCDAGEPVDPVLHEDDRQESVCRAFRQKTG